ncbi:GMP synthase [glutamine-hydrolyzing], amidotransferase subunit / GMP synthase [glutamine-hydrolyzing], ATP pyrophosphatase subunit, partial [hydrothermal vent metagenome]
MSKQKHQAILIVDFGSQVTQLIARRLRELNVYCEIHPYSSAADVLKNLQPKGIILSGGPASVLDKDAPAIAPELLDEGVPILGICYGQQALCVALGGKVEAGHVREFGRADVSPQKSCSLFDGVWETGGKYQVWMSHGDKCSKLPEGFEIVAASPGAPMAIIANEERRIWATQFHPEVYHTPDGIKLFENFVKKTCGCTGDWTMATYRQQAIEKIREQVGSNRVICGLSGGVDSSVAAVLLHEAIGDQLTCVFVDHGLLRKDEAEQVVEMFSQNYNISLIHAQHQDQF